MATHSNIRVWRILWTEEPGGAYGPWGHKESDTTEALSRTQLSTHTHTDFSICASPNERGGKSRALCYSTSLLLQPLSPDFNRSLNS